MVITFIWIYGKLKLVMSTVSSESRIIPKSNSSELSDQVQPINSFIHPNTISDDNEVIGHIPKLMALWVTKFLKRATNSGTVVITGKRINRGAGYGVELPCQYTFQGDEFSCKWLKDKLKNEHFDVEN